MSIVAESFDEGLKLVVVMGIVHDFFSKNTQLLLGRELSVDNQEGSLKESRFFSQLLDRVASVLQDALISIDERNL